MHVGAHTGRKDRTGDRVHENTHTHTGLLSNKVLINKVADEHS